MAVQQLTRAGGAARPRAVAAGTAPWMEPAPPAVRLVKAVLIAAILTVMIFPFVYIVVVSFASADSGTAGLLPTDFSLDAYRSLLSGGVVGRALLVSAGVTVVGTVLSMFFTILLAFGLTRSRDMPGGTAIFYAVLATMLFSAGIIPSYLTVKSLGLLDSYWALILPTLISAFNLVVVRNFMQNLPPELLDSARIDGANEWQLLWRVVVPLSRAVLAVVALFYAVGYWNSFFTALLYLDDTAKWPIQLVLNTYVLQGSPLDQIQNPEVAPPARAVQMAVVVLSTVPILLVYPFVQRYFTSGVLTGAIKG